MSKIAIVGIGIAGLCTAVQCLTSRPSARITIFKKKFDNKPQNITSETTSSYHSGGGMIDVAPKSSSVMKYTDVNWGNTDMFWLWAFIWESVLFEGKNHKIQNQLSQLGKTWFVENKIPFKTEDCGLIGTRWIDSMDLIGQIYTKLLLSGKVKFVEQDIKGAQDTSLETFDKVFMCRGAADNSVFRGLTEVVAGLSMDHPLDTSSGKINPCFRWVENGGYFVSTFEDKKIERITAGLYIGYNRVPESVSLKPLSKADPKSITEYRGNRVVSIDSLPFFFKFDEKVTYVNGGSFVGMHTYPIVCKWAVQNSIDGKYEVPDGFDFNPEHERLHPKRRNGQVAILVIFAFVFYLLFSWYTKKKPRYRGGYRQQQQQHYPIQQYHQQYQQHRGPIDLDYSDDPYDNYGKTDEDDDENWSINRLN